ncbi:MAG: hypothetical protein ACJ79R_12345 [Anaeromyxobacteraceae bacterium]
MNPDQRNDDLTDFVAFEDLVKEMDEILDGWFMGDVAAALEDARTARGGVEAA